MRTRRVGLIVPSSNTTIEAEVPALLRAAAGSVPLSVHSSRMRMRSVEADELARMNAQAERCTRELADAAVEVQAYACLVAIMSQGPGAHRRVEAKLSGIAGCPVHTSAGALVAALHHLGARRIALLCPYLPPLARLVIDYLEHEGITVVDHIALGEPDNLAVGAMDPRAPIAHAEHLDLDGVDVLVASACVQMPSLASLSPLQERLGIPVLSAASATAWSLLRRLDLPTHAPAGGALLAA